MQLAHTISELNQALAVADARDAELDLCRPWAPCMRGTCP